jgi:hypothetical protein
MLDVSTLVLVIIGTSFLGKFMIVSLHDSGLAGAAVLIGEKELYMFCMNDKTRSAIVAAGLAVVLVVL